MAILFSSRGLPGRDLVNLIGHVLDAHDNVADRGADLLLRRANVRRRGLDGDLVLLGLDQQRLGSGIRRGDDGGGGLDNLGRRRLRLLLLLNDLGLP